MRLREAVLGVTGQLRPSQFSQSWRGGAGARLLWLSLGRTVPDVPVLILSPGQSNLAAAQSLLNSESGLGAVQECLEVTFHSEQL